MGLCAVLLNVQWAKISAFKDRAKYLRDLWEPSFCDCHALAVQFIPTALYSHPWAYHFVPIDDVLPRPFA